MKYTDKLDSSLLVGGAMSLLGAVSRSYDSVAAGLALVVSSTAGTAYNPDQFDDVRKAFEQGEKVYWENEKKKFKSQSEKEKYAVLLKTNAEKCEKIYSFVKTISYGAVVLGRHDLALLTEDGGRVTFPNFRKNKRRTIGISANVPQEIIEKIRNMAYPSNAEEDPRVKAMNADPWFSTPSEFLQHENQYKERWAKIVG